MPDTFLPGDSLHWVSGNLTRPVVFRGLVDPENAAVDFGLSRLTAPLDQLSRPAPPVQQIPVVPLPPPEPEDLPSLAQQRTALRHTFDKHRTAQQATTRAREIADRALGVVEQMQARLRDHSERENKDITELVTALHDGGEARPLPSIRWVQNEQIRRDCAIAERVYDRVVQELAVCREQERAALDQIHKLAADIVGLILSAEIEKLHELEQQAAELRSKLQASCLWWPPTIEGVGKPLPLSIVAQQIINSDPPVINDPLGYTEREALRQHRQQPFADLFESLVAGDADAELI